MAINKTRSTDENEEILDSDVTRQLDDDTVDLGEEHITAGYVSRDFDEKHRSDARRSFERDYNDVLDYEE